MKRATIALVLIAVIAMTSMFAFAQARKTDKVKDPVCGIMVDKDPDLAATHKGEVYYFCSKADMEQFKKNPDKYAKQ